jgi:hypothetical protein
MNQREGNFDLSALMTPPTPEQSVDYIHELLGELISMARSASRPVLAHLLEMAKLEADGLLKKRVTRTG